MTRDLLEENQDLRKQVEELKAKIEKLTAQTINIGIIQLVYLLMFMFVIVQI